MQVHWYLLTQFHLSGRCTWDECADKKQAEQMLACSPWIGVPHVTVTVYSL